MSVRVFYDILNQKGTPAMYTDTLANRPAFGFQGRLFISTDSGQIFEDTGTSWTLVADAGVGGGTLSSVCLNGNTTATGIVITAGGLSSNSFTNTGTTAGSVLFAGTSGLQSESNSTFFWDNTNKRLGIGNASPGAPLDIHGTGTQLQLNGTGSNNSYIQFQNAGVSKWRIGNLYNAGANSYEIYDVLNATTRLTILNTGATTLNGALTSNSVAITGGTSVQFLKADGTTDSNTYLTTSSASSTYLPLAGGTLTGALSGTSITGTSLVKSGGTSAQILAANGSVITAGTNITISGGTISASGGGGSMAIGGSITSATAGSVLYAGASGVLAQSNANFYYDYTNNRLGLGTTTPISDLDITKSVSSAGSVNINIKNSSSSGEASIVIRNDNYYCGFEVFGSAFSGGIGNTALFTTQSGITELGFATLGSAKIAFRTNSTGSSNERMSIFGSTGNISINTTTDSGYKLDVNGTARVQGIVSTTSRLNVNGATDNALFSLNSGGTLYTTGFSPNAQASSLNTLTLTSAGTVWIYNGTGVATWTLFNPSGTNQMVWIKNAGTGIITLNAYSGTNIINNSGSSVSSITIAVGATALIQQDGNVKSYQLQ